MPADPTLARPAPTGSNPSHGSAGATVDVVIVGGGPAGLAAALALGRARRTVRLVDAGPRRNQKAVHLHNFVTRDGTTPDDFRAAGHAELAAYPTVSRITEAVSAIAPVGDGDDPTFDVAFDGSETVRARRVLLATGMVDRVDDVGIEGFARFWGDQIFQCPYCHGYEVRDRRWGFLALKPEALAHGFPQLLLSWTDDVVVFTHGAVTLRDDQRATYRRLGIGVETAPVAALVGETGLRGVSLVDQGTVPLDVLFAHPPQRQVDLVDTLVRTQALGLDEHGFVQTQPMSGETSIRGLYAAGDLASGMQGAIMAAAAGTRVASMVHHGLALTR